MKLAIYLAAIVFLATLGHSVADAAPRIQRDQARTECSRQAAEMMLAYRTAKRRNFINECMIDQGFQSR
jgi:hypothetical protein